MSEKSVRDLARFNEALRQASKKNNSKYEGFQDKPQAHWEQVAKERGTKDVPGGIITPAWLVERNKARRAYAQGKSKEGGWKLPAAIGAAGVTTTAAGTAIGHQKGQKKGRTKGRREGFHAGHYIGGRRGYAAGQKDMLRRIANYNRRKAKETNEVKETAEKAKEKTGSATAFPVILLTSLLP